MADRRPSASRRALPAHILESPALPRSATAAKDHLRRWAGGGIPGRGEVWVVEFLRFTVITVMIRMITDLSQIVSIPNRKYTCTYSSTISGYEFQSTT